MNFIYWNLENFQWMQLINASETSWKKLLKGQKTNLMMVSLYDQHLTEPNQVCLLIERSAMSLMVKEMKNLVLTQSYYKSLFDMKNLDQRNMYFLLCEITINAKVCLFQYTIRNSVLYLNEMFIRFGKVKSSLFCFCKLT